MDKKNLGDPLLSCGLPCLLHFFPAFTFNKTLLPLWKKKIWENVKRIPRDTVCEGNRKHNKHESSYNHSSYYPKKRKQTFLPFLWGRVSLCNLGWLQTQGSPASASGVLGFTELYGHTQSRYFLKSDNVLFLLPLRVWNTENT